MFSSADIPQTTVDTNSSSSSAVSSNATVDDENTPAQNSLNAPEIIKLLSPFNPDLSRTALEEVAEGIVATKRLTDSSELIASLESLATKCQFDPESLAFLANWHILAGDKLRAIVHFRHCLNLHAQNPLPKNEAQKTIWRYRISMLLTLTGQYEEARMALARTIFFADDPEIFDADLKNEILKTASVLNEKLLMEFQRQAYKKSKHNKVISNLKDVIDLSILIHKAPLQSEAYVHRATAFVIPYKATRDRHKLEAAYADYCMAYWLTSTNMEENFIENREAYLASLKKNCSTLASKLGYINPIADSVQDDQPALPDASHVNDKRIFILLKSQSLYALNPDVDYEKIVLKAQQIYTLYSLPAVLSVPMFNEMKKHYKLDGATLSFIAEKEKELLKATQRIHDRDKSTPHTLPTEKTAEARKLIDDFIAGDVTDSKIHEKSLSDLISVLEFDIDTGRKFLDINEQTAILKKAISILKNIHLLPEKKNAPTDNAKKMADKFSARNPAKAIEYINLAITEEENNAKNYLFRADMQFQSANDVYHYQLALADYCFARWAAARTFSSILIEAKETDKITRQINLIKKKISELRTPAKIETNTASVSLPDNGKNKKKKNKSGSSSVADNNPALTETQSKQKVTLSSDADDSISAESASSAAATPTISPIDVAPTIKSTPAIQQETEQAPRSETPKTLAGSATISSTMISAADYGNWEDDTGFTLHTNRKQKREKPPSYSSSYRPKQPVVAFKKMFASATSASHTPKPAALSAASKRTIISSVVKTTAPTSDLKKTLVLENTPSSDALASITLQPAALIIEPTESDTPITPQVTTLTADTSTAISPFLTTATPVPELVESELPKVSLPPEARTILLKLKSAGAKLSLAVGGIVRDDLLGISTEKADIDIVTQASPEDLKKWFPLSEYADLSIQKEGKLFQFTLNKRKIEIWSSDYLANAEASNPLKDDALSRAFNIEALYADEEGNTFDPLNAYGCEEIDTLTDPVTSLQHDPVRILRAIYFTHKTSLKLSARLDKAIDDTIFGVTNIDKFSLRAIFSKIINNEKSADIFNELDRRGIIQALFPEFVKTLSTHEICERIRSTNADNSLSWVYINMALDAAIDTKKYRQVMAIQDPQQKLTAINQFLAEIPQHVKRMKSNKLLSASFSDENYFESLLQTAFQSNHFITDLKTEQTTLVKTVAQVKNAIETYVGENNALREQNEALILALQQKNLQQEAAAYQQQLAQQQAYQAHVIQQQIAEQQYQQYVQHQQALHAEALRQAATYNMPSSATYRQHQQPVVYHQQAQPLSQHRNGFVNSWQNTRPRPQNPNPHPETDTPTANEHQYPGRNHY